MDALCCKAWSKARQNEAEKDALNLARCAIKSELNETLDRIKSRGGLLHVGCAA